MALVVNNLPANRGDLRDASLIPGPERILEEGRATHSRFLDWIIPWTEEPVELHTDQKVAKSWT